MSIGKLVESLNAKAAASGCAVRAEHITIDRTWGDHEGVAIVGTNAAEIDRAVAYAERFFGEHIAPRRTYDAQYAWADKGTMGCKRSAANGDSLYIVREGDAPIHARVIGLAYYPCAD